MGNILMFTDGGDSEFLGVAVKSMNANWPNRPGIVLVIDGDEYVPDPTDVPLKDIDKIIRIPKFTGTVICVDNLQNENYTVPWYGKLRAFDCAFENGYDDILFLDNDVYVTNQCDQLMSIDCDIGMVRTHWGEHNSGVIKFKLKSLYNKLGITSISDMYNTVAATHAFVFLDQEFLNYIVFSVTDKDIVFVVLDSKYNRTLFGDALRETTDSSAVIHHLAGFKNTKVDTLVLRCAQNYSVFKLFYDSMKECDSKEKLNSIMKKSALILAIKINSL